MAQAGQHKVERPAIRRERKLRLSDQATAITLLYVFLFAGGLWHVLGIFQTAMRILAAPLIIALTLLLCVEYFRSLGAEASRNATLQNGQPARFGRRLSKFLWWSAAVIVSSFLIELAGVKTGMIFGAYEYGKTLQPTIMDVPLAIGFAWLGMILSAAALSQHLFASRFAGKPHGMALAIALLMVIFDFFMEPAAMRLNYWNWQDGAVPLQNYVAWFVLGYIFAHLGLRLDLFTQKQPALAMHAYFAQLVYFVMVNWI
jgi:putative membrane protein